MIFKYTLPEHLIEKTAYCSEFALGGTQVNVKLKDGRVFRKILISNSTWIVAMRGYDDLPFSPSEIEDVFQTDAEENPEERGGWKFWDDWSRQD